MRLLLLLLPLVVGCVYDDSRLCGPDMTFAESLGVCTCASNAIPSPGGCTACADDEVVTGEVCACAAGEAKNAAGVCATVLGFGEPCADSSACTSSEYPYCAVRDDAGTCTTECGIDTDCPASYVCTTWETTPSCRTYTGYGAACSASEDCAAYDASDCIQGHCVVQGCTVGVDDCPRDTKCCDFSAYGIGTVCAPAESCS